MKSDSCENFMVKKERNIEETLFDFIFVNEVHSLHICNYKNLSYDCSTKIVLTLFYPMDIAS